MNVGELDYWFLIKLAWIRATEQKISYHINYMIDVVKSSKPPLRGWQRGELRDILKEYYPKFQGYEKLYEFNRWLL
jgi:hypothetical protein